MQSVSSPWILFAYLLCILKIITMRRLNNILLLISFHVVTPLENSLANAGASRKWSYIFLFGEHFNCIRFLVAVFVVGDTGWNQAIFNVSHLWHLSFTPAFELKWSGKWREVCSGMKNMSRVLETISALASFSQWQIFFWFFWCDRYFFIARNRFWFRPAMNFFLL